jgi:hypothetical protein
MLLSRQIYRSLPLIRLSGNTSTSLHPDVVNIALAHPNLALLLYPVGCMSEKCRRRVMFSDYMEL